MKSILFFNIFLLMVSPAFAVPTLPTYKVDVTSITISGVSSGAFMANQMATAFSNNFSGAASVAGGIFWCSQGSLQKAQTECMNTTSSINSKVQIAEVKRLAVAGEIDPLENLAKQKQFIFASPKDAIIKPPSSDKLYEFLKEFSPVENIKYDNQHQVAHGFPTLNYGASCAMGYLPWLLNCNVDTAGDILNFMYPQLQGRIPAVAKNLLAFDQKDFGNAATPLFANGWVYVPTSCQEGHECKLHVALHGCQMNPDFIQDQFAKNAGYNEWAESNGIIVLYPQSGKLGQQNPNGCWDWFGFTGTNYVTKKGKQMISLKAMIDRIVGRHL